MSPWFVFWQEFFRRWLDNTSQCKLDPNCSLDELSEGLSRYLKSAEKVAEGAAKNVEDAKRLMAALEAFIERKKNAAQPTR